MTSSSGPHAVVRCPVKNASAATDACAAGTGEHDLAVVGEQHRRHPGGGVGVGDVAPDRAPVAHRRVRDPPGALDERGQRRRQLGVVLQRGDAPQRPDPHDVGVDGDVVELGHPGDVDEDLGAGRARAELGDQRLATGQHPGPPPGERGDRLVDGGGALVAERRGLHLIACGLTGEPTEPVIVSGGATSWNS